MKRRDFLCYGTLAGAGLWLSGCAVNPVSGRRELMLIDQSREVAIDRAHSPHQISADYGVVTDRALAEYLAGVGQSMVGHTHRQDMPYRFLGVNATYINAYAFPGGTIGITRGILLQMESEAQLAALLGHELAHINARHTAQRMSQSMLASMTIGGLSGAIESERTAALAAGLGQIGAGALLAGYSRDQEREADQLGLEYAVATGYDPAGMVDLMAMLQSLSQGEPGRVELLFSTHPMSRERHDSALRQASRVDAARLKMQRERYMDHTASLRAIEPAIVALQRTEALMGAGRLDEAFSQCQSALEVAPEEYVAYILSARIRLAQEKPSEALTYAVAAQQLYPAEAQAWMLSGLAALNAGRFSLALDAFEGYEKRLEGNPATLFYRGYSHENLKNRREASRFYEQFLESGAQGAQADHARKRLIEWSG